VATILMISCSFLSGWMNDTHFPGKGLSEDFKSRTNPGQDLEIKDCPGKSRSPYSLYCIAFVSYSFGIWC